MGYVDSICVLSDAQALTSTALSTNTFDTLSATNDIGVGEPVVVEISVDTSADFTTGDETYTFAIVSSASANLGTPTTLSSRAIVATSLTAGTKFYMTIPPGKTQRYLGLNYTLAGTTPSITVTSSVKAQKETSDLKYYPKGYTVS